MPARALLLTYILFFFLYFFGIGWLGHANSGQAYPWASQFEPLDFSYYTYTLLTVLLAHLVVFRKFYYQRPAWRLWVAILALLIFFISFRYLLEEVIYPAVFGYGNYNPVTTTRYYIIDNIYFGGVKIFLGFVLFLFDELIRKIKREAELKEQNRLAELNFLQAQMNPHFLFNSLNNIYGLATEQHPATPHAVLQLSEMMRYVTYQKGTQVSLAEESHYIRNLLEIQQLRMDHPLRSEISISPAAAATKIPPLLLIPLVENAIKHGDLSDPSSPLRVHAVIKEGQLQILVSNKKRNDSAHATGGVGLKNLERRLFLLYRADQYKLQVTDLDNHYSVTLTLPAGT